MIFKRRPPSLIYEIWKFLLFIRYLLCFCHVVQNLKEIGQSATKIRYEQIYLSKPQKARPCARTCVCAVLSYFAYRNFIRLTFGGDREKNVCRKNNKSSHISRIPPKPHWSNFHQIWHGADIRDIIRLANFLYWWLVKVFWFYRVSFPTGIDRCR